MVRIDMPTRPTSASWVRVDSSSKCPKFAASAAPIRLASADASSAFARNLLGYEHRFVSFECEGCKRSVMRHVLAVSASMSVFPAQKQTVPEAGSNMSW